MVKFVNLPKNPKQALFLSNNSKLSVINDIWPSTYHITQSLLRPQSSARLGRHKAHLAASSFFRFLVIGINKIKRLTLTVLTRGSSAGSQRTCPLNKYGTRFARLSLRENTYITSRHFLVSLTKVQGISANPITLA